jgi:3-oxoadipate enol-lactonase
MPHLPIPPYGHINYQVDDFIRPWEDAETVVLVHGFGESMLAWNPWVPVLAKKHRVVRLDQRGFGQSAPMPEDFPWTIDVLADDLARLIETVSPRPIHLVGCKIGGPIVTHTAAKYPNLIKTLTLSGTSERGPDGAEGAAFIKQHGIRAFVEKAMDARMKGMSDAAVAWWYDLMGATAASTAIGFLSNVSRFDVREDLKTLKCPTLVITADSPRRPIDKTLAWQATVPDCELKILENIDAFHISVAAPDLCAEATMDFIAHHSG